MGGGNHVSVTTWNILGDPYRQHERITNIVAHLRHIASDIILLQEAWDGAAQHIAQQLNYSIASDTRTRNERSILTRLPVVSPGYHLALPGVDTLGKPHYAAIGHVASQSGRTWRVASAHLSWGGKAEAQRLDQAVAIDKHFEKLIEDSNTVGILGGDFNCTPTSATISYLTGKLPHQSESTYWVDAWEHAGTGDGHTSTPSNPLAQRIANTVGISAPHLLPDRRIDYIFTAGYAHGRPGCPTKCTVTRPENASDHEPVTALLWDPPIEN